MMGVKAGERQREERLAERTPYLGARVASDKGRSPSQVGKLSPVPYRRQLANGEGLSPGARSVLHAGHVSAGEDTAGFVDIVANGPIADDAFWIAGQTAGWVG